MRAIIVLVSIMVIWMVTPALADVKDRDRHDRQYGKDRDHYVYKVEKNRDHRHNDYRHGKAWKKKHRPDRYWKKKHRKHRHVVQRHAPKRVVYREVPTRVVYREPVIYYPSSYVTIGAPNVSLRFTW